MLVRDYTNAVGQLVLSKHASDIFDRVNLGERVNKQTLASVSLARRSQRLTAMAMGDHRGM